MVTQSEESMTLMTSCGVLSIYLITVADPSLAFRMTLTVSVIMMLPLPIVSNAFPQSSFRTGVRMLCGKMGKQNGDTE